MPPNEPLGGQASRQTARPAGLPLANALPSASQSAARVLLTAIQAAEYLGVSERKFHDLRAEAWMPKPVVLGPRMLRWVRSELEQATASIPRDQPPSEPAQLRRARIEAMKAGQPAPLKAVARPVATA